MLEPQKQMETDRKSKTQFHTVLLCLHVADPATFLASDYVLGIIFSSENSLFVQSCHLNISNKNSATSQPVTNSVSQNVSWQQNQFEV